MRRYVLKMLDDEIESADSYSRTFIDLKFELRLITSSSLNNTVIKIEINSKRNFKLPKTELQKFNGDLKV